MKYLALLSLFLIACNDTQLIQKERVACDRYKTPWVDVAFLDSEMISYRDYGNETTFINTPQAQACEVQTKTYRVAKK